MAKISQNVSKIRMFIFIWCLNKSIDVFIKQKKKTVRPPPKADT